MQKQTTQAPHYIDQLAWNIPTKSKPSHSSTRVKRLAQRRLSSSDKAMSDHSLSRVASIHLRYINYYDYYLAHINLKILCGKAQLIPQVIYITYKKAPYGCY